MDYTLTGRGNGDEGGDTLLGGELDLTRSAVPGFRFEGFLEPGPYGARAIAACRETGDHVVFHAIQPCTRSWGIRHRGRDAKRFVESISPLRRLQSSHALPILDVHTNLAGAHWVVTPFVGSSAGVTSLREALAMREGGRLEPQECLLAAEHLLAALRTARSHDLGHGAIRLDDVIVDRRGALIIELFGVRRALGGVDPSEYAAGSEAWGEVRSVARLVYRLYTGVDVPRDWIEPERLVKRGDRRKPDRRVASWVRLVLFREQPLGLDEAIEALNAPLDDAPATLVESLAVRARRSVLRAALRPLDADAASNG